MSSTRSERTFGGQAASPGLAIGTIDLRSARRAVAAAPGDAAQESAKFEGALATAALQLAQLIEKAGDTGADILEFQVALLEDAELLTPARQRIAAGAAAVTAWRAVLDAQIADYEAAEDAYFRARAADLADLRERVAELLLGIVAGPTEDRTDGIYVGEDLAPSRFLELDWQRCRGVALAGGSSAGHVAILARARGVPLVVGLGALSPQLIDGAAAILDAESGRLIQDPSSATRERYAHLMTRREAEAIETAAYLPRPAMTRRGERVTTLVNIDHPGILASLDAAHCDGVGLTRTEFLFSGPGGLPDEAAQLRVYESLLAWAGGKPVTIRTLDAGGDKPIAGLTPDGESNPFLGLRGLRLSLTRPDVFRVQLRALARAAVKGTLKIMVPMVTVPRELAETRKLFADVVAELKSQGIAARLPSLGMMVEVPSAALNVAAFDADFFSIGSNDLVQYVTATSRDCAAVQSLHDPLDPGVLELIGRVVAHGKASGREVSLCGDMAADPRYLPALLDTGLRTISVAPAKLARVKAEVARYG
jgi:phosphoenolpyruvate-protein phosphotransferase (PTS system enzyme I)